MEWSSALTLSLDNDRNLYIVEDRMHRIFKYDPRTQACTSFAGSGEEDNEEGPALQASFISPIAIAFDRHNNGYISDWHDQTIRKYDATTGIVSKFKNLGGHVSCIAVDKVKGETLFVVDNTRNKLVKLDLETREELGCVEFAEFSRPWGMVQNDDNPDEFFFTRYAKGIIKLNFTAGVITMLYITANASGLYYHKGCLYFLEATQLKMLDLRTGSVTDLNTTPWSANGLVGEPEHEHCFYVCNDSSVFKLY